ncbi:hypothetical protein [Ruminococcus albus]|uniref:Uncharacterized protein n=1 Tax=Ruminococcus albus TaxID=1264 RepID=A0A1I1G117_RUMAL|nr:hypothetical protein [Ruminococcus albus]SFC02993.1 hypothetical protein SAMN02910406_01022 [Ruminococcus albus]
MKKITAFAAAVIMALSITACIDKEKSPTNEQESISSVAESQDENSETSREDLLKEVNLAAEMGYNLTSEYLADMESMENLSEETKQEAAENLALVFTYYERVFPGGTVGICFDNNEEFSFTVQFRADEDSSVIGQYPDPAQSLDDMPEWSEKTDISCKVNGLTLSEFKDYVAETKLKSANGNAKSAYNAVAEYLADMEFMEKLSEASADEAAKKAAEELSSDGYSGIVGVKLIDLNECNFQVFWHSDKNPEIVGRYPEPPQSVEECPEWDVDAEYKCSGKPRMKNSKKETEKHTKIDPELKTAITNAKKAYSAVEVYIGDMETKGELSEVTEQSAADVAAAMLKDYEISGIIGVTITDLYHEYPQFEVFWRESEDSNIVGKYPYPPQSVDDCPEWDVGAYSYVK